jgi:hypothetical protein
MRFSNARRLTALAFSACAMAALAAAPAQAANSAGCDGGAFSGVAPDQSVTGTPTGTVNATIPATGLGTNAQIRGKFQTWDVDPATLGVKNFTFTSVANKLSMTGGKNLVAFASKTPDLKGAALTGALSVELDKGSILLTRTGTGVSMTIQSKDCASGGIFQMEPERSNAQPTVFTHVLGPDAFYYDNPNFRARIGEVVDGTAVTARTNIGIEGASRFVGRDSTQEATRLSQFGKVATCSVKSGGRMGPGDGRGRRRGRPAATACTHQCGAQSQTRGEAVVLGFPFPVPAASASRQRCPPLKRIPWPRVLAPRTRARPCRAP